MEEFFAPDSVAKNKKFLSIRYIAFVALGTIGILLLFEWMPEDTVSTPPVNDP